MADHLASAMGVDECAISYWDRPNDRLATLGYFPAIARRGAQAVLRHRAASRRPGASSRSRRRSSIDADDPAADPAEVALLAPTGYRSLVMLPLVAKGQSIGLVELMSRSPIELDAERLELARTMANEAAMALENARLYEEARALADRDPLTGFYNHRYLHERFGEEVVRAQRSRRPLSVLMLDLDDFKLVNDTFGHLFGDQVLALDGRADPVDAPGVGHPRPLRRRRVRDPPARHRPRGGAGRPPSGSARRSPRRAFARRRLAAPVPVVDRGRRRDVPGRRPERDRADRRAPTRGLTPRSDARAAERRPPTGRRRDAAGRRRKRPPDGGRPPGLSPARIVRKYQPAPREYHAATGRGRRPDRHAQVRT